MAAVATAPHRTHVSLAGTVMCLVSAAAFGAMAVFGKLAFDAGVTIITLLAIRFTLSAAALAPFAVRRARAAPRKRVLQALSLGAFGYAAQSALYFLALQRVDAGLVALLLYTFPALVTLGAVALGRDTLDRGRVASLALAFGGLVLVLSSAGSAHAEPLGIAMALGAALVYTVYILSSEPVLGDMDPRTLTALVCSGGAVTYLIAGAVSGRLDFGFDAIGWLWLACIVGVSTLAAVILFFAGLTRVGPSRASIISTVEPLVTVGLAFVVFGERLSAVQLLGGALVLGSVVLLQLTGRRRRAAPPAAR
jgi:drug/metabolite transporter (DMT)-like permease